MAKRFDPNSVTVGGRLSRKPELKHTPSGKAVTNVTLANNNGEINGVEQVSWIDVVVWGSQAERLVEYMDKGSYITVEGRLQTRSYEERESGKKRTATEVLARSVYFESKANSDSNQSNSNTNSSQSNSNDYGQSQPTSNPSPTPAYDAPGGGVHLEISDDDIPF